MSNEYENAKTHNHRDPSPHVRHLASILTVHLPMCEVEEVDEGDADDDTATGGVRRRTEMESLLFLLVRLPDLLLLLGFSLLHPHLKLGSHNYSETYSKTIMNN